MIPILYGVTLVLLALGGMILLADKALKPDQPKESGIWSPSVWRILGGVWFIFIGVGSFFAQRMDFGIRGTIYDGQAQAAGVVFAAAGMALIVVQRKDKP